MEIIAVTELFHCLCFLLDSRNARFVFNITKDNDTHLKNCKSNTCYYTIFIPLIEAAP